MKKSNYVTALIAFLMFLLIAITFDGDAMSEVDKFATSLLAGHDFVAAFHYLADTKWMVTFIVLFIVFVCLKWHDYRGALFILVSFVGGFLLNQIVKNIVERPRPSIIDQLTTYSFPSAHSMLSLLYLFAFAYVCTENISKKSSSSKWIFAITLLLTVMIGFSRVAESRHFITDVLAGWSLATAWLLLCVSWYKNKKQVYKQQTL